MMKSTVKKIDAHKCEVCIEISGERVSKKFDDAYAALANEVKVDGFRPGKAPRAILEKQHAGAANQRVLDALIGESCDEAIKKENIDAISISHIKDVQLRNDFLSFTATVEIKPEIKLKEYKGIALDYKKIEVTDAEIQKAKESIKESRQVKEIDESFAKSLGYASVADLDEFLKHNIYVQKDSQQHNHFEHAIVEKLLKDADFSVPKSVIERQLKDMVSQAKVDLAMRGLEREQIEAEDANITKRLEPEAEKQVKIYWILEAIAKKENIAVDNQMPRHVIEFLLRQAKW